MTSTQKPLGILALTLMNIVTVGSLQIITSTATYGFALISLYAVAIVTYFIPSILMTAELATRFPITGGAYIWVERAFGKKTGFFAICLFWFANLIYYPTIFSLIATGALYVINPDLVHDKGVMFLCITGIFWLITLLNCFGIRISSLVSSLSSVLGVLLPAGIIMALAMQWLQQGQVSHIEFSWRASLPDLTHLGNIAFLSQVIVSLAGIELSAAHAGDVQQPKRSYPLALLFSAVFILVIVMGTALAIAVVIPSEKISVVSGLLDAFTLLLQSPSGQALLPILFLIITIGNFGFASAWMIGATRAMYVACKDSHVISLLQKTNRFNAPVGILVCEACIFTVASFIFWWMPSVDASYWVLLNLACQISFIYNTLLFFALYQLKNTVSDKRQYFKIPGGNAGVWFVTVCGSVTSLFAVIIGFFPPEQVSVGSTALYVATLAGGLAVACCLPFILLRQAR